VVKMEGARDDGGGGGGRPREVERVLVVRKLGLGSERRLFIYYR
jgi:hypothetical protein